MFSLLNLGFCVLFNDALNTFLINGFIGVGNILIGKIPSGIDLRSVFTIEYTYTKRHLSFLGLFVLHLYFLTETLVSLAEAFPAEYTQVEYIYQKNTHVVLFVNSIS